MQVKDSRAEQRRIQIVEATIEVIAQEGYSAASFARIVKHAGLSSTRLVSYHFDSKDALMLAALLYVVSQAGEWMRPAIAAEATASGKLAAYISSNLDFLARHPAAAKAAVEILRNAAPAGESSEPDAALLLLSQLFQQGQAAGEMRHFEPLVMARSVRAAIDAAVGAAASGAELTSYAAELVELFRRATTAN